MKIRVELEMKARKRQELQRHVTCIVKGKDVWRRDRTGISIDAVDPRRG